VKTVKIDPYTASVSPVDIYFDATHISRGAAFYWADSGKSYLVTNWHNVTGRDHRTSSVLDKRNAALPNRLEFDAFKGGNLGQRVSGSIDLYQNGKAVWLEHPEFGQKVDVVCIEVDLEDNSVFAINELSSDDIGLSIAQDVFILGYPMGIDTQRLPIWKRGSVASEPDIDAEDLPLFYVDSATSKGLSGSPVILRKQPGLKENGKFEFNTVPVSRFVGVYSGRRVPRDKPEANLGFVWKKEVVPDIISGGRIGSTDWQSSCE